MSDAPQTGGKRARKVSLMELVDYLLHPDTRHSLLTLVTVGFAVGILFWGGFNWAVEASNKLEFCISCHEMENHVYKEYRKTVHYQNRSGVQAVCADCHVPKEWGYKVVRKIAATKELWGKVTGSIDTPEKFEAKRLALARSEWKRMKVTDSRECRNCHGFEGMNIESQKQRARKQHETAQKDRQTCIDCHKGIAHQKPKGMTEEDES